MTWDVLSVCGRRSAGFRAPTCRTGGMSGAVRRNRCRFSERLLRAGGRGEAGVSWPPRWWCRGARSQGEQVDLAVEGVVAGCADQCGGAGDGEAVAEAVVGRAAGGGELGLLGPGGAGADELVGGAGEVVVQFLADHRGVAGDGQGVQGQTLAGLAIGGGEGRLAGPAARGVHEYVGGAGEPGYPGGADECGGAGQGDRAAEQVAALGVRGAQDGLLREAGGGLGEDVRGAGGIALRGSDDDRGGPGEGDGPAELV